MESPKSVVIDNCRCVTVRQNVHSTHPTTHLIVVPHSSDMASGRKAWRWRVSARSSTSVRIDFDVAWIPGELEAREANEADVLPPPALAAGVELAILGAALATVARAPKYCA